MRLEIELVPKSSWYSNVRSNVSREEWDVIRKRCYDAAGNKCEICGDVGFNQGVKHAVECHEIWEYDDSNYRQTLVGFISLCPLCHKCKHIGLAKIKGEGEIAIRHLMKVNKISRATANNYVSQAFSIWAERNKRNWELDISYIKKYLT